MPASFSYIRDYAKISLTGLTSGTSYTIYNSLGEIYAIGYTKASYSHYLIKPGLGFTIWARDSVGLQATFYGGETLFNYDGSFLIGSDTTKSQQIFLVYDENISSLKPVRKDFIQETIGSKYPFVIRNASVNYETMEFSGMISSLVDPENYSLYGSSFIDSNYNSIYNKEREFRAWFESWMTDGRPKVLKTATEGLKIVRVTNLSLTPLRQTGRVIYNFSCTITEIADYTISNLRKYKFLEGV